MAFSKFCPICRQQSFSASDDANWLCPHCGENLKDEPAVRSIEKFLTDVKNEKVVKIVRNE